MEKVLDTHVKERIRSAITSLCSEKEPISTDVEKHLKKLDNIKAIYFDVYGTIMISGTEPGIRNNRELQVDLFTLSLEAFEISYNEQAPETGISYLHDEIAAFHAFKKKEGIDYPEVDIILVWEKVFERLTTDGLIGPFDTELIPEFLTDFVIRYDDPWLMPGLNETISALHAKNLKTGIISNSSFYTPLTLEALSGKTIGEMGFKEQDCFWSFAEDIAKPSVRFYELAKDHLIKTYNIKPEEMLFVGNDMLNDVYPAQAAGFKTALFAGDLRSLRLREGDSRIENIQPDIVITELTQIMECID